MAGAGPQPPGRGRLERRPGRGRLTLPGDSFATRHRAWTADQHAAADAVAGRIERDGLGVVRLAFADAHGVLRGKTLVAAEAVRILRDGANATTTLLMKDLSGKTAFPVFGPDGGGFGDEALRGAADMVMLPDPLTFRVLPWAPHTGWLLCDLFLPDGRPMPFSTRGRLADQVARLAGRGLCFTAGVEIECHILARGGDPAADGRPATPGMLNPGYQYLTELRYDALDPVMEILRGTLQALDLPLRTLEVEFGPSQVELTFGPAEGLMPADQLILVRSAVKQVCARNGMVASFMSRPRLPGVVSSGWHLHQSVTAPDGRNLFAAEPGAPDPLSALGLHWLGGLLDHAAACCAFTTPTLNGYRRYRPFTNAPTRACWGIDNRGGMVRVLGGPGDPASRIENRAGEPGANPYLAMAAQIAAGLDGVDRQLDPGPPAVAPYEGPAPLLPRSLPEALDALAADACLGRAFGPAFIDYFIRLKQAEIDRFLLEVTEWEQSEYFEML